MPHELQHRVTITSATATISIAVAVGPFDAVTLVLALTFDVALALPGI